MHNYGSWEKHGFKRPQKVQQDVLEVDVRTLDENAALYAADDLAEETEFGYRIDARDVVEDGHDADVVKVLGSGQVYNQLEVTADAFSASAVELIESEGGEALVSERAREE